MYVMNTTTALNSMNSFILINKCIINGNQLGDRHQFVGYLSFDQFELLKQVLIPMFTVHFTNTHNF